MKYYCKHCESEWSLSEKLLQPIKFCPLCGVSPSELSIVHDYETPEQYEKRMGKPVSDDTAVWFKIPDDDTFRDWMLLVYADAQQYEEEAEEADVMPTVYVVIANPPVPPPDGWRPMGNLD